PAAQELFLCDRGRLDGLVHALRADRRDLDVTAFLVVLDDRPRDALAVARRRHLQGDPIAFQGGPSRRLDLRRWALGREARRARAHDRAVPGMIGQPPRGTGWFLSYRW